MIHKKLRRHLQYTAVYHGTKHICNFSVTPIIVQLGSILYLDLNFSFWPNFRSICLVQTWKLFLWVPQTQIWSVTGSSRAGAIFQAKSNIKPLPTPKTIDLKCYLIPFCSNSDFWMQNQTIFGPFCLKKSDFRPKSEKIGSLGTASVWFLNSALMVPQACLWCLRLFSCLQRCGLHLLSVRVKNIEDGVKFICGAIFNFWMWFLYVY